MEQTRRKVDNRNLDEVKLNDEQGSYMPNQQVNNANAEESEQQRQDPLEVEHGVIYCEMERTRPGIHILDVS